MMWATRSAPVALDHVADDLVAPVVREVDVHVRHRDPLGVQEALEDEPVADRVHVGDAEAVGDERARRGAAARPHRDALLGARSAMKSQTTRK